LDLWLEVLETDKNYGLNKILTKAGTTTIPPFLTYLNDFKDFDSPFISPRIFHEIFENWSLCRSNRATFFTNYDIILCPVSNIPAHPHGFEEMFNLISYTTTYNLTGWPMAVVRVGVSSDGLPIGIQIVGKPWQEDRVLAVAKFLETKFGGFQPPVI